MKVCIVIDHWLPNIGGGPRHVWEIAQRLSRNQNIEIEIITSQLLVTDTSEKNKFKKNKKIRITYLGPHGAYSNMLSRFQFLYELCRYLWLNQFDIIHVHPFMSILPVYIIARLRQKPIILTVHTLLGHPLGVHSVFVPLLRILDYLFSFKLPYNAQIVVDKKLLTAPSSTVKRVYIPNGVDVNHYNTMKKIKHHPLQFLFVGRLHKQKNLENLIRAFSLFLKSKKQQMRLLVVGDGLLKASLEQLIQDLGLQKRVLLRGTLTGKRLLKAYKSSSVFILPSVDEGFPLSILEAWAAKLPVISTPVGAGRVLVKDHHNGFLAKNSSSSGLQEVLEKAYRSKNLLRFGHNGYRMVKTQYSWDHVAKQTREVYNDVYQSHQKNKSTVL